MLLATTILLLVFRSPSATISVMWLISAKMFINEKPPFRLRKFHSIANLCATLNAATTFIMFIIYGTKFRSEFTRVYCCCFKKFQRKKTIQIKQDQQQEQQQIKQLLSNDNNENEQDHINQMNTSSKNPSNGQKLVRHSSSATTSTTTTSIVSLSSLRRLRNHRRKQRYSLDQEDDAMNSNNNTNYQQHELTIREDDCNNENNDKKSVTLRISYCDWFKSLIRCQ
jgi:hypothetical protein